MKAKFRPNRFGGWYYTILDDNGEYLASGYVSSYKRAVKEAKREAAQLSKTAGNREHVVDLETGVVSYTQASKYTPEPDYDPNAIIWVKAQGMREDGRVSIRLGDIKELLSDA